MTPSPLMECTVELFGVARLIAGTTEVPVTLAAAATCSDAFTALLTRYPALGGRVIARDGSGLLAGYACNVNGRAFVRDTSTPLNSGDRILILAADAGG